MLHLWLNQTNNKILYSLLKKINKRLNIFHLWLRKTNILMYVCATIYIISSTEETLIQIKRISWKWLSSLKLYLLLFLLFSSSNLMFIAIRQLFLVQVLVYFYTLILKYKHDFVIIYYSYTRIFIYFCNIEYLIS